MLAGYVADQPAVLVELLTEKVGREESAQLSRREASAVLDKLSAMTGYAR